MSASFAKCRNKPLFKGLLPWIGTESLTMLSLLP
jgi:hypothetical protein